MKANDAVTQDHIEFLEAQLLEMEVENQILKEELLSTEVQLQEMIKDRTFLVA